jgi:hypothetical protein
LPTPRDKEWIKLVLWVIFEVAKTVVSLIRN